VLVEVTSDSTEDYDRGEKLRHYQQLPSAREVLFVSHREPRLTLYRRSDPGWTSLDAHTDEAVDLISLAVHVTVDEIYRDGLEDLR
jgi:Uma2 family endonuclease